MILSWPLRQTFEIVVHFTGELQELQTIFLPDDTGKFEETSELALNYGVHSKIQLISFAKRTVVPLEALLDFQPLAQSSQDPSKYQRFVDFVFHSEK